VHIGFFNVSIALVNVLTMNLSTGEHLLSEPYVISTSKFIFPLFQNVRGETKGITNSTEVQNIWNDLYYIPIPVPFTFHEIFNLKCSKKLNFCTAHSVTMVTVVWITIRNSSKNSLNDHDFDEHGLFQDEFWVKYANTMIKNWINVFLVSFLSPCVETDWRKSKWAKKDVIVFYVYSNPIKKLKEKEIVV